MSFEEKNTWIFALVSLVAYGIYVVTILGRAEGGPLAGVPYVEAMLWSIGGAIVAGILGRIVLTIASPKDADKKDERDKEIYRFGEFIGQSLVVLGGVGALILSMLEADYFWISNSLYLTFVLSALLGSAAKIVAYRRGFQGW